MSLSGAGQSACAWSWECGQVVDGIESVGILWFLTGMNQRQALE